jgi:tyrosyl-tRNA synthetase
MVQGGGVSINKIKMEAIEHVIKTDSLLNNKFILVQKGRRNYYLVITE